MIGKSGLARSFFLAGPTRPDGVRLPARRIRNPRSAIQDPRSAIRDPGSVIRNPGP
jgi:hypothetical protein